MPNVYDYFKFMFNFIRHRNENMQRIIYYKIAYNIWGYMIHDMHDTFLLGKNQLNLILNRYFSI